MPRYKRPAGEGRLIQLVYHAYVAGSALARAIPERAAYGLAHHAGGLWARASKKRRDVVRRNLMRVTGLPPGPELDSMVVEAFRSYARYWLETFRLVREGPEFFLERFVCEREDRLDGVVARGKGAIVVVGHLGNWDAAGAWVGARGQSLVTVVEVLKPRRMFEFFAAHRARLGMKIYPAEKGVTDKLAAEIEGGAVVAIIGDRDLKGTGIEVALFGEKTTIPAGAASLALRTGVPLLAAGVYSETFEDGRRGWSCWMEGPIELPVKRGPDAVTVLTEELATYLERAIARRPEEWHVQQPFWSADRDPARTS